MIRKFLPLLFLVLITCDEPNSVRYPELKNSPEIVNQFGRRYTNEFGILENLKDSTAINWFKIQDSLTEKFFNSDESYNELLNHYTNLENRGSSSVYDLQFSESGETFYIDNPQDSGYGIYWKNGDGNDPKLVFKEASFKEGDFEIVDYEPSYDSKYLAIALGKDDLFYDYLIIVETESGKVVSHEISNTKPKKAGGLVWSPDSNCLLFIYYPNITESDNDRNSYTAQFCVDNPSMKLEPIFKNGMDGITLDEEFYPIPRFRSAESNYLFIYTASAADHWDCYYITRKDYVNRNFNWKLLFTAEDKILYSNGIEKDHEFFFKKVNGNNIELGSTSLDNPNFNDHKLIYKGNGDDQLASFVVAKEKVYYGVSRLGVSEILNEYDILSGEHKRIPLPFSAGDIDLTVRSPYNSDLWVDLSGWTSNDKKFHLEDNASWEMVQLGKKAEFPEFDGIISELVLVEGHDGVEIPMSIIRKKNHNPGKNTIGLITAYGAYGLSESPWFHSPLIDFVNQGHVYAVAHVRGGGEKGPAWHEAGKMNNKENSWKDLISCSEYLIKQKLINEDKLALNVNSAGGIAGGMAVNKRPDLFKVFTGFLPTLNVIRTEHIESMDDSDILYEFGTIKDSIGYSNLLSMDPVVNMDSKEEYPSTLFIIGYRDYLIHPSGPGKYIAKLQHEQSRSDRQFLLDIKFDAQHEIDWVKDYSRMLHFVTKELKE